MSLGVPPVPSQTANPVGGVVLLYRAITPAGIPPPSWSDSTASCSVNASVADYLRNDWMNENVLTYKRKYNNKHNFDVMVGFTMQGTTTEKYGFETTNIPDEGLSE